MDVQLVNYNATCEVGHIYIQQLATTKLNNNTDRSSKRLKTIN